MELQGEHVLITGANRGIGWALARSLASEGCHLHLVMRKAQPELVLDLKALNPASVTIHEADLSSFSAIEKLWGELKKQSIPVGVLINNAGLLTGGLLEEQNMEEIYQMVQINLLATIHLTSKALPDMIERGRGKIVNNSSVSGVMHLPCASTYTAAKTGVVAFTESLRQELRGTGVSTLLLLTPGIKTRMYNQISEKYSKHMDVSGLKSIEPEVWAEQVKEAILEDIEVLKPSGWTAVALRLAQHVPELFEVAVRSRFRRDT